VGLVGFGRLAQAYYAPALRRLNDVTIAAIIDPLSTSLNAAHKSFPDSALLSSHEEIGDLSLDALLVASPPSSHLAALNFALHSNLPVFIEKPILLPGEIHRLEVTSETRRLIMPNFNRRFWPAYQRLREICTEGLLGNLRRTEFRLDIDVRPWLSVTTHRIQDEQGGALCDLGSSQLDLIQYVLGQKISRLHIRARSVKWRDDHISIEANLEDGTTVDCRISYGDRNRETIAIFGASATARIENPNCAVHLEATRSFTSAIIASAQDAMMFASKALLRNRSMLHYTIRSALMEFFGAMKNRRPFSPNFTDAVENDRCLVAATRSLAQNASVEIVRSESSARG
jgi:predicted dehydrogenase